MAKATQKHKKVPKLEVWGLFYICYLRLYHTDEVIKQIS